MAISEEVLSQLTAEDIDAIVGTEVGTTYLNSKLDSLQEARRCKLLKRGKCLSMLKQLKKKQQKD